MLARTRVYPNKKIKDDYYEQRAPWFWLMSKSWKDKQRSRLYFITKKYFHFSPRHLILDMGVSDRDDNYFHKLYPYKKNITAAGLAYSCEHLKEEYPQIKYVQIGKIGPYPFLGNQFDFVHCSAVIEHVGSRRKQAQFLKELIRVGKSGVVTTPNRWYPLEFHTFLPFIHWLPTKIYRKIFRFLGFKVYAQEQNLNLLTENDLNLLIQRVGFKKYKIVPVRSLGLVSNYLLFWGL